MHQIDPNWEVSVADVKAMMDRKEDFLLLDVRQPQEFAICRINGASLIPLNDLGSRIEEVLSLADDRPVVVHCHHGGRSLSAAAALKNAGVEHARSMARGIDAWPLRVAPTLPRCFY